MMPTISFSTSTPNAEKPTPTTNHFTTCGVINFFKRFIWGGTVSELGGFGECELCESVAGKKNRRLGASAEFLSNRPDYFFGA